MALALSMKANGVILMSFLAYSAPISLRNASISLMSASSNCVTCGIVTQLRCRFAPEIFFIRDRAFVSIAPNLAKSISGISNTCRPLPPAAPRGCASDCLTKFCTSSLVTRPFSPLPLTCGRFTPSSRAKRRMDGLACALPDVAAGAVCAIAGAATGADFATGAGAAGATVCTGAATDGAAAATAPLASIVTINAPSDTLSPTLTLTSFTTPSNGAGTSIVALSVSSVSSVCSALTWSPAFTATSITGTSL